LGTGCIFCLAMLHYGLIWIVFPSTLLFYGLSLVSASRFTYKEVFYLGLSEIGMGCLSLFFTDYSLIFWVLGFGLLHIVYGLSVHNRYDRALSVGKKKIVTIAVILVFSLTKSMAQITPDSTVNAATRFYEKETIYLRGGNSFVKNNTLYTGQRALAKEFLVSTRGMDLYMRSRRFRTFGLVVSLAGSAVSIASLFSGNTNRLSTILLVSIGTGVASSVLTMQANNLRDQSVWVRNRDVMSFMREEQ
jgi:hypothetical protein